MIKKFLLHITRNRPCKVIDVNGPYIERYFMTDLFGYQVWLHRFLQHDGERHLHGHPWTALSVVLHGWYNEMRNGRGRTRRAFGLPSLIKPDTEHRIIGVRRGTWTLMIVGPSREDRWYFVNDAGEREYMAASQRDWWRHYGPREAA